MSRNSRYHKCAICGKISDNFNDAIDHALTHVTVQRSYSFKHGFYVCPLCSRCFNYEYELQDCMDQHGRKLKEMGYVITKGDNRE